MFGRRAPKRLPSQQLVKIKFHCVAASVTWKKMSLGFNQNEGSLEDKVCEANRRIRDTYAKKRTGGGVVFFSIKIEPNQQFSVENRV
jgi:hypothetical protein